MSHRPHNTMVVALSFVVIVSPLLYAILLTSKLSLRTKVVIGSAAFVVLVGLPVLTFILKINFGLS